MFVFLNRYKKELGVKFHNIAAEVSKMKDKIIIVGGDPNSVNSEIIYKVFKRLNQNLKSKIYIISNFNLLKSQFKRLNYKIKILQVKNVNENQSKNSLKIIDVPLNFKSFLSHLLMKAINLISS